MQATYHSTDRETIERLETTSVIPIANCSILNTMLHPVENKAKLKIMATVTPTTIMSSCMRSDIERQSIILWRARPRRKSETNTFTIRI